MNENGNEINIEREFPEGFIDYLNDSYEAINVPPLPGRTSTAVNSQISRIESRPSSILSDIQLIEPQNNHRTNHADGGSSPCTTAAILFMSTVCLVLAISLLMEKSSSHLPLHTQINRFTVTETLWETTKSIIETRTRKTTETITETRSNTRTVTNTNTETKTTTEVQTKTLSVTSVGTSTVTSTVTSTTTEFTQPTSIVPRAQAPYPGEANLALRAKGALILTNYTTEPGITPDTLIQPSLSYCWPIAEDAAIGVQLGKTSLVSFVSVHFQDQYTPNEVLVYRIDDDGSINMVGKSVGSGRIEMNVPLFRLVVRIKSVGHQCVQAIEVLE